MLHKHSTSELRPTENCNSELETTLWAKVNAMWSNRLIFASHIQKLLPQRRRSSGLGGVWTRTCIGDAGQDGSLKRWSPLPQHAVRRRKNASLSSNQTVNRLSYSYRKSRKRQNPINIITKSYTNSNLHKFTEKKKTVRVLSDFRKNLTRNAI